MQSRKGKGNKGREKRYKTELQKKKNVERAESTVFMSQGPRAVRRAEARTRGRAGAPRVQACD